MIVEGPIITIICGFLLYLGFLNVFVLYPLLVFGDLIGDALYYAIGKYASRLAWVQKILNSLGYTQKSKEFLENHFEKHTWKTLLLAKISHGIGGSIQVSAGMAGVKFRKYIFIDFVGTVPKTLALLLVGFYLGHSYMTIDAYLDYLAYILLGVAVIVVLYLILNKYTKNYFK